MRTVPGLWPRRSSCVFFSDLWQALQPDLWEHQGWNNVLESTTASLCPLPIITATGRITATDNIMATNLSQGQTSLPLGGDSHEQAETNPIPPEKLLGVGHSDRAFKDFKASQSITVHPRESPSCPLRQSPTSCYLTELRNHPSNPNSFVLPEVSPQANICVTQRPSKNWWEKTECPLGLLTSKDW